MVNVILKIAKDTKHKAVRHIRAKFQLLLDFNGAEIKCLKLFNGVGVDEKTWNQTRYQATHHMFSWVVLLERMLCY